MLENLFARLPFNLSELLIFLATIIGFVVAGMLLGWFFKIYVSRWAKKTKTTIDDLIVEKIKPPFSYVIWFIGLKVALHPLNLNYIVLDRIVDSIILFIIIWVVAVVADILVKAILEKVVSKTKSEIDDALVPLAEKTLKVIIWAVGIIWILGIWNVDIRPILGGLGIAGLAIGFAVKDSLSNIFGGIALILDRTIKVGDKVKLQSGETGFIVDVGLRSTKLKTFNNEIITIPNGQLVNSRIQNYGQPDPSLKVSIDFGVNYNSDVDLVRKVVSQIIKSMDGIMDDPAVEVLFLSMGDSSLNFSARFWVPDHSEAWDKKLEATDKIFRALKEAKIDIPFPTQTVYVKK